jgi:hypothetical protein
MDFLAVFWKLKIFVCEIFFRNVQVSILPFLNLSRYTCIVFLYFQRFHLCYKFMSIYVK